jgi:competence protein ComEA
VALSRPEVEMREPFADGDRPTPVVPEPPRPFAPPERGLERVYALWEDSRVRIAALLVVALVAGLVWYRLGVSTSDRGGASARPEKAPRTSALADGPATTTTTGAGGMVVVHVAGDVAKPGVVRVAAGARVVDAIEAAGGGLPDADLDRLNLAAKVADGQRVAVAKIGAPAPVEAAAGAAPGDPSTASGPVNLNSATQAELEELPGIGPSLAAAIVAEREKRGGFHDVAELQDVRGIGERRYADIKDLVAV